MTHIAYHDYMIGEIDGVRVMLDSLELMSLMLLLQ